MKDWGKNMFQLKDKLFIGSSWLLPESVEDNGFR